MYGPNRLARLSGTRPRPYQLFAHAQGSQVLPLKTQEYQEGGEEIPFTFYLSTLGVWVDCPLMKAKFFYLRWPEPLPSVLGPGTYAHFWARVGITAKGECNQSGSCGGILGVILGGKR